MSSLRTCIFEDALLFLTNQESKRHAVDLLTERFVCKCSSHRHISPEQQDRLHRGGSLRHCFYWG